MFAVKGWSVDASALRPQTEPFHVKSTVDDSSLQSTSSRKRKRHGANSTGQSNDVGVLWDRHIEGKNPKAPGDLRRKEQKKEKVDKLDAENTKKTGPIHDVHESDGTQMTEKLGNSARTMGQTRQGKKKRRLSDRSPKVRDDIMDGAKSSTSVGHSAPLPAQSTVTEQSKLTPMQVAMRQKLISARFRHLNQTLYTAPSTTALDLFNQNPDMFEDYHAGFRQQVAVWPENPLDTFVSMLRIRGTVKQPKRKDKQSQGDSVPSSTDSTGTTLSALPRTRGTCVVADLGCGDARLAQTLSTSKDTQTLNLKIHSFDLHSTSPLVIKADISNVPLADGSVDVAIFCLALMGTNWISFIEEAYRILHWKGELWIAEIKSRFGRAGGDKSRGKGQPVEHSVGSKRKTAAAKKARDAQRKVEDEVDEQTLLATEVDGVESTRGKGETDVAAFVDVLKRRGFVLKDGAKSVDFGNKMFVRMEFVKGAAPTKGKQAAVAPNGQPPQTKKFLGPPVEDVETEDEAKVLKPCLYKIR